MVIVGEVDVGALASDLTARLGAYAMVGALPRRGALVRCLAPDASALGQIIDAVWDAARQALMGHPAPRLRKG